MEQACFNHRFMEGKKITSDQISQEDELISASLCW